MEARYKRAHLSAIRFEGIPAQDRRYGPIPAEPTLSTRNRLTSRTPGPRFQDRTKRQFGFLSSCGRRLDRAAVPRSPPGWSRAIEADGLLQTGADDLPRWRRLRCPTRRAASLQYQWYGVHRPSLARPIRQQDDPRHQHKATIRCPRRVSSTSHVSVIKASPSRMKRQSPSAASRTRPSSVPARSNLMS